MSESTFAKYFDKLQTIIEQECDGSRMSSTKWKEMFDTLSIMRQQISFDSRVKLISGDVAKDWWGGLPSYTIHNRPEHGPTIWIEPSGGGVAILALEWIEIRPTGLYNTGTYWTKMHGGYQNQIEEKFDTLHVPYTLEAGVIHVTGHVRRSTSPTITRSR